MQIKKYIITVHHSPLQLKRLISALDDSFSYFYVHVDLKSKIEEFTSEIENKKVEFITERVNCIWADFSQVEATINLLKSATRDGIKNSTIIFISGQDYPIKSKKHIREYFTSHCDFDFIDFDLSPIPNSHSNFEDRILRYKINLSATRNDFYLIDPILSSDWSNFKLFIKLIVDRKIPLSDLSEFLRTKRKNIFSAHYKGANWFSLNYFTVMKILFYINKNKKKLYKYYKYTLSADEQFFQTILMQLKNEINVDKIQSNNHYIDWNRQNVPLPVTFTSEDIDLLLNQNDNKLYARKFDISIDKGILDLLDDKLLKN